MGRQSSMKKKLRFVKKLRDVNIVNAIFVGD